MLSSSSVVAPLRLLILLACVALPAAAQATQPPLKLAAQPLAFEPNRGQTSAQVSYLARGKGYLLFLEPTGAVLSLKTSTAPKVLHIRLVDAASRPKMRAESRLPGRHNYYIGNDPKRWHTAIPTYGRVSSAGVYPGIDMVYHGRDGQLEYDFMVAPHAEPRAIRLAFAGSDAMTVNDRGDLILDVGGEKVVQRAPYAYQTIGGKDIPVDARYAVKDKAVSFALGRYDATKPLIIDPALIYASYLGGTGDDQARAVAVDVAGNIYITGSTQSSAFPGVTSSSYQSTLNGSIDAFVTQLDSSGTVIFSTYLGAVSTFDNSIPAGGEKGNGIAVINLNGQEKIYVTGGAAGGPITFPYTNDAYKNCTTTNADVFVTVLNAGSGQTTYSTCVGGGATDEGYSIAVDSNGDAYVVGYTASFTYSGGQNGVPFPTTSGALQTTNYIASDLYTSFFFKLHPNAGAGAGLIYSTYLGSTLNDQATCCNTYATAVAVDNANIAYVAGWTGGSSATAFPTAFQNMLTTGAYSYGGGIDSFFYKINPNPSDSATNNLLYASYLGGSDTDRATGIAIASSGNNTDIYITGQTTSSNFPTLNAYQSKFNGGSTLGDVFVAKFSPATAGGSNYMPTYSTYLGGVADDAATAIAVDVTTGRAYVTGVTASGNFPVVTVSGLQSAINLGQPTMGLSDAFVASLEPKGSALHYSTFLGGSGTDQGLGIAAAQDGSEKVYVAGGTSSTDFPVTANAAQKTNQGGVDAFVAEISPAADVGVYIKATNPAPSLMGAMSYTVTVTNYGPDPASNVTLALSLSANSSATPLSNVTYSNNGMCTNPQNDDYSCALTPNPMPSGGTVTLTFSGQLTAADLVTATATVAAKEPDPLSANNTYTWTSTAGQTTTPPPIIVGSGGSSGGGSGGGSSGGGGGGSIGPLTLLVMLPVVWGAARRNRRA